MKPPLTLLTLLWPLQGAASFVQLSRHPLITTYQSEVKLCNRLQVLPDSPKVVDGPVRSALSRRPRQPSKLFLSHHNQIIAVTSMALLAVEFGATPTLQKKCVPRELCRSSMMLAQEIAKFTLCAVCLQCLVPPVQRAQMFHSWTAGQWMQLAGIPATLYAIQNYAKLMAFQHLPPVTFSVLNQTKTLSTAVFCFLLLGLRQSPLQMLALLLLLVSALVIENVIPLEWPSIQMIPPFSKKIQFLSGNPWAPRRYDPTNGTNNGKDENKPLLATSQTRLFACASSDNIQEELLGATNQEETNKHPHTRDPYHFSKGVLPIMLANLTSGLASALTQRALQHHQRNLYLFGMELSSASFLIVLLSLLWSPDGQQIRREGFTCHWKAVTVFPVAVHAGGGLLVGIVTKYAGSVQKGFALIFGVLLSGLFQKWLSREPVTKHQVLGGVLACLSMWMHSSFPPAVSMRRA